MLFKPLIWYNENSNTIDISQGYQQKELFQKRLSQDNRNESLNTQVLTIALVEMSEHQIFQLFNQQVHFCQTKQHEFVLAWNCMYNNKENFINIICLPNQSKAYQNWNNFITKFMMNISHILIFNINCKHLRSQSNSWPLGRQNMKYYITISSSDSLLLYEVPISQNFHRLQLSNSICRQQFQKSLQSCYGQFETLKHKYFWNHALRVIKNKTKLMLQSDSLQNSCFLFETAIIEYFLWQNMMLNDHTAQKIILQKKKISIQELNKFKNSLKMRQIMAKINQKMQNYVIDNVYEEFKVQNQLLSQRFLTDFLENELLQYEELQQLQNDKTHLKTLFLKFEGLQIIFSGIFCIRQNELMKSIISNQSNKQNQLIKKINTLEAEVQNYENIVDQNNKKISEQTQIIEFYKKINQQYTQTKANLQNYKASNENLQSKIEQAIKAKTKSDETQEWLRKYISSLVNQKSQFQQQIQTLTKDNTILMTFNKQLQRQIHTLASKLSQLQQLKQNSRKFLQREQLLKKQLQNYESWSQKIQSKYEEFLQVQKLKFNQILQRNFEEFKNTTEKNQILNEQIERIKNDKQRLLQQLELERNKSHFYEEKMMKFMEIQRYLGNCDENVILEDNAEYDPTSRKQTQREMILNHIEF